MQTLRRRTIPGFALTLLLSIAAAQSQQRVESNGAVRVRMTVNSDDSRTTYRFKEVERKCVATTTSKDGKMREKIRYDLDEAGRFLTGRIFGPDGKFLFKSRYKYDSAGRMEKETQMNEQGDVLHLIIYRYDQTGRPTGYSVFDANGKLENRLMVPTPSAPAKARGRKIKE
ncbi:MAG: hypothetical protein ACREIW_15545 [Chthoniobacterales bacterium]